MKKMVLLVAIIFTVSSANSIPPLFNLGTFENEISAQVIEALEADGFQILGEYNPGNQQHLSVIAFTNNELKETTFSLDNRAALASVLKVGMVTKDNSTSLFLLNPEYMFYAYLQDKMDDTQTKAKLMSVDEKVKKTLRSVGTKFEGTGGNLEIKKLKNYRYMFGMQDFNDPVDLNEFSSFKEGVNKIQNSLNAKKGNTIKVYEIIENEKEIAVFGIGLLDMEDGEAHFLKIIGENHVAAMPYEIILQGKEASMLHGRFRFALYWPELTMGTFTKIMSTPGDVKDFMKDLTE